MDFDYNAITFEIVDINARATTPSVYISHGKLIFNKSSVELLHQTKYAQYCVNVEHRILAVKECNENDFKAMRFATTYNQKCGITFGSKVMLSMAELLIEDFDVNTRYVITGEYDPEKRIMYYNFQNAQCINCDHYSSTVAEARFYKFPDDILEEINAAEEEGYISKKEIPDGNDSDKNISTEETADNISEENENAEYGLIHQETIPYKPGKNRPKERSSRWEPLNVRIYINDKLYDEFVNYGTVLAHDNDRIKIIPSKQVLWRGHTVKTIDTIYRDFRRFEFEVHSGKIAVSYLSRYSIDEYGQREKGRIQFRVT